ncbi:MAG: FtsX-like permease family protein [Candidatus Hodarchaeota archaeon]
MVRGQVSRGKIRLLFQMLRINLKKSLITLIGMMIALAMIASCLIYLESNEIDYFLGFFEEPMYRQYPVVYHFHDNQGSNRNFSVEEIKSIQGFLNNHFTEFSLNNTLIQSKYPFMCSMSKNTLLQNTDKRVRFLGITFDESIIENCVNGSRYPRAENEVLVYLREEDSLKLAINETSNFSVPYNLNDIGHFYNLSLNVSGILTKKINQYPSFLRHMVDPYEIQIILNMNQYLSVLNTLRTLSDDTITNSLKLFYSFDFSHVNQQNVLQIVNGFAKFRRLDQAYKITVETLYGTVKYDGYRTSSWSWSSSIEDSINKFQRFVFVYSVLCIPAFLISFLLVNFSLGIINERRRKTLTLYKMRGISNSFLFVALSTETITLAFIASGLGIIIGIPVFILIAITTGYLNFDLGKWPQIMIISQTTVLSVIGTSLCLSFLLHLRTIIKLANAKIVVLEEEASKKKKRKRGTIRQNIDIFLLVQGIIGIIVLNFLLRIANEVSQLESRLGIFIMLVVPLIILSPLFLLIGFLFAYNRLIPFILDKLGGFFWRKDIKMLAVATRNLIVNIKVTIRTTILLTVTISFLMILSSLPVSFNQHYINTTYYKEGSDFVIRTRYFINESTTCNLSMELNELTGVTATTVSLVDYGQVEIMGIEDNFDQVAFWKAYYAKQSLSNLVSALYSSESQFPVIIDTFSLKLEKLKPNDQHLLNLNKQKQMNVTIVDTTEYWPKLIGRHGENDRFLIIKSSTFYELIAEGESYIWCKIDPSSDKNEVLEQARNVTLNFGVDTSYLRYTEDLLIMNQDDLEGNLLWIITNFNFLVALLVLLLLLFLFTMTRLTSQSKEIGLSRALGMKFRQVFLLMFIEPFVLVLISGLPGGLIGLTLLMVFINLGQGPPLSYDPPFILTIDIPSVLFIYGSILFTAIIAGLITSYRATRADVSKILKVE